MGLSVSNGKDQLVVFHTKDNKDLIVCLFSKEPSNDSKIGELVGVLASHFKRSVLGGDVVTAQSGMTNRQLPRGPVGASPEL